MKETTAVFREANHFQLNEIEERSEGITLNTNSIETYKTLSIFNLLACSSNVQFGSIFSLIFGSIWVKCSILVNFGLNSSKIVQFRLIFGSIFGLILLSFRLLFGLILLNFGLNSSKILQFCLIFGSILVQFCLVLGYILVQFWSNVQLWFNLG